METRPASARDAHPTRTPALLGRRALVLALLGLALFLRMREPLSSPIIGAEDPYLHMARTWDLLQGNGLPPGYPPGFAFLLVPFAILGPEAFYAFARFGPPFLGVVQVLGVYLLAREHLRTPAAFVAALAVALMPENVFRTNLLFPTALDLALLPFFLLFLLRAANKDRKALVWASGIALVSAFVHPWVLVYMLPPTALVALRALHQTRDRALAWGVLGVVALAGIVFAFLPGAWNPAPAFLQNAGPRLLELLRDPRTFLPLPRYVETFPGMVTWSVIALAGVGVVTALVRRTTLGLAALVYTLAILPFVFVDWFDVWFIPHRSVAYLSLGLALLAALPVELMGALPDWNMGDVAAAAVIGAYLLTAMTPAAAAVEPWYRLYDENDQQAWNELADREPDMVVTGSWEAATGYRAATGRAAVFNPDFFSDAKTREAWTQEHDDIIVLLDQNARDAGIRAPGGWREVGRWGDSVAYRA